MRLSSKLATLFLVLVLGSLTAFTVAFLGCGDDDDDDDDDDDTGDDDAGDDDTGDDDTGDDDSGEDFCAPITEPFPPAEEIYQFLDLFTSMADLVMEYQDELVALGQVVHGFQADSFQVEFPHAFAVGEHDMRWEADPNESEIMGVYIIGLTQAMTYEKAFYVYRGCMTIEETGEVGDYFRATFTDLYMTEAEIDLDTGQISIMMPGEGLQAFIMEMTIECDIVPFTQTPSIGDICMHMD